MESSTQLWEAWKLARAWSQRPSEVYGITDEVAAWCFDRAVFTFGVVVDDELKAAANEAKNKQQAANKQQRVLQKYLGTQRQFRDPAAMSASGGSGGGASDSGTGTEQTSEMSGPVTL